MLEYLDLRSVFGVVFWTAFPVYVFLQLRRFQEKGSKISLNRVGWPLLGTFLRYSSDTCEKLAKLRSKRGEVFSVYLGSEKVTVLNSGKAIEEAFAQVDAFDACRPESRSLFFTHGLDLDPQQKKGLAAHSFDLEKLEAKIQLEICHFLNLVEGYHGCQLDFDKILDRSTANIMCLLVFGRAFQYGEPELMTLIALLNETSSKVGRADLHSMFPGMKASSSDSCCADSNALQKATEICKKKIEEHRTTFNAGRIRDFIDSNLEESDPNSLTDESLCLACMDYILAGTEAASSCVMWCMYILASHPDVKAKVVKEVALLGRHRSAAFADQGSMPYVRAFVQEVIRWKTIVPVSSLKCASRDVSVCGCDIPRGSSVLANFWAVNNDPEAWSEPRDFRPERFLKDGEVKQLPFSSFGGGKCPGESIVFAEVFLYVVSLMRMFDVRFLPGLAPDPESDVFLNRPTNLQICMPLLERHEDGIA